MKNPVTLILAMVLTIFGNFFFGALLGYKLAISKHDNLVIQIQAENLEQLQKEQDKTNDYKAIAEKNYQDYLAAINREPDVITERVYVKATCPTLPAATSGGVGDAGDEARAELHAETVARVAAVTQQAEIDVLQCQARLTSLQEKIRIFNNG